jgi:predicted dehydrogenase
MLKNPFITSDIQGYVPKKVGVGVLGYSIGRVHAHAWRDVAEVYHPMEVEPELVALYGRTKKTVEFEAAKYGYKKFSDDWKAVVKDEEVQIVDNCLPVALHPEPTVMAAELGKNLFCEKPLARRASDAKRMLDAAEKNKVKHMVGYNYRFMPAIRLAREMIAKGEIGKVSFFKGSYLTTNTNYDDPNTPMGWHFDSAMSGYGALSDLGTHALDLARYLVGEVGAVSGAQSTIIEERPESEGSQKKTKVDVDDLTVATMKFRSGALGVLEASWACPGRMDYLGFEIYGTLGSLRFSLERLNELEVFLSERDKGTSGYRTLNVLTKDHPYMNRYWPNQGGGFGWDHSFVNEFHHFLVSIADDKPIGPQGATFLDGYRNCLIMDAIADSAENEKWVAIRE